MSKGKHKAIGAEALFGAAFTYALTGILVREVAPMWGDKAQVSARFAVVLVLLLAYVLVRQKWQGIPKSKFAPMLWLGLVFAGMVLAFTSAIGKTTVANVLFVFYAVNMLSAFAFGSLILKESITRSKLIALAFALAGLTVYSGAILGGNLGIILSIFAGVCGGAVSLISKQLNGIDRISVLTIQYAIGAFFAAGLMLLSRDEIVRTASLKGGMLTLVFALVIILGSYLTLYGFQNFDVNVGTVIMSAELIIAAIMAYFLYNEVPRAHELLGGVIIFTGSVIASGIFDKKKSVAKQIAQPD
jgi:drug/metabolite transporter (DMT)-like permease